jgi:hypothetical protein
MVSFPHGLVFPLLVFHKMWIYTSLTLMLFCLDKGVHLRFTLYTHIESPGSIGADAVGTGEQVTKCPRIWEPGNLGTWESGYQGTRVPGHLMSLNVEVSSTLLLLDKIFHNLRIWEFEN